jgi:hypothetical protein
MQSKFAPACSPSVLLSILSLSLTPQRLQEASVFFKKRAMLEEEFGRGMQKLAKNTADIYAMNDGKAGCVNLALFFPDPSGPNLTITIPTALSSMPGRQP